MDQHNVVQYYCSWTFLTNTSLDFLTVLFLSWNTPCLMCSMVFMMLIEHWASLRPSKNTSAEIMMHTYHTIYFICQQNCTESFPSSYFRFWTCFWTFFIGEILEVTNAWSTFSGNIPVWGPLYAKLCSSETMAFLLCFSHLCMWQQHLFFLWHQNLLDPGLGLEIFGNTQYCFKGSCSLHEVAHAHCIQVQRLYRWINHWQVAEICASHRYNLLEPPNFILCPKVCLRTNYFWM